MSTGRPSPEPQNHAAAESPCGEALYEQRLEAAVECDDGVRELFFLLYHALLMGVSPTIPRLATALSKSPRAARYASEYSVGARVNVLVRLGLATRDGDAVELLPPPDRD